MMPAPSNVATAFQGNRATYVALAAVSILVLSIVSSVWHSDVSGSIALLGLLSIYMSSVELLVLFTFIAPASIIIDIGRLWGVTGHAWLVFFAILEMLAKAVGGGFAYSLYRSIESSPSMTGPAYSPIVQPQMQPQYYPPGGSAMPVAEGMPPMAQGDAEDPFASYAPPRAPMAPTQPPAYNTFPG